MNLILTSSLNFYHKDNDGKKIAQNFGNENGIMNLIKKLTPKHDNFVFVASSEFCYNETDIYASLTFDSFRISFPFKNYVVLDGRTKDKTKEIIENADLIFLCGGHVPTQNKFFQNINLKEIIKNTKALIIGQSAGSMNSADVVYAQPEIEGESVDPTYKRYLKGLGLTKISILPHFEQCIDDVVDGKNIFKEISIPDSKIRPFIAYSDGAYIYDDGVQQLMYGKAYLFENGSYHLISQENAVTDITQLVKSKFCKNNCDLIKE